MKVYNDIENKYNNDFIIPFPLIIIQNNAVYIDVESKVLCVVQSYIQRTYKYYGYSNHLEMCT